MSYDQMWKVIRSYNLKIHVEFPWLCGLCQKILIDTYEAPCGCIFCKQCITDYLKDDNEFCPSDNDNCKLIKLNLKENIIKVKSIDRKISELKIQCPLELCDYKTELSNMFNHIENCDKRIICCPYNEVGCLIKAMQNQPMQTHLSEEFNNHNSLLMQKISFFNEQIIGIKNDKEMRKNEISDIKTKLTDEINQNKVLIENLTKEFQSIKSIVNNIENKCNNQEAKFEQWKTNFQSSLERLYDEYINKNKIQRKRKLGKSDRLNLNQSNQSINFCDFRQKTCSNFTWRINEGLKMKNNISSGDFLTKNNLFLMKLELSHRNPTEQIDWDVRIRLFVKYNLNDENFQDGIALPFDIVIIVKNLRNIFFNLKKSNFSEIKIFKHFYVNKSFDFSYRELEEAGINPGQPIIIECKFDVN